MILCNDLYLHLYYINNRIDLDNFITFCFVLINQNHQHLSLMQKIFFFDENLLLNI